MEAGAIFSKYKIKPLINIVIIIFCFLLASSIHKQQGQAVKMLEAVREEEAKKNEELTSLGLLDKKIKAYKSFLNKKNKSLIIADINSIAKASNVKITSIRPESEQAIPMYMKCPFQLALKVPSYETLGRFISALESSDDVYALDILDIKPYFEYAEAAGEGYAEPNQEKVMKGLTVNMLLSTFFYKD